METHSSWQGLCISGRDKQGKCFRKKCAFPLKQTVNSRRLSWTHRFSLAKTQTLLFEARMQVERRDAIFLQWWSRRLPWPFIRLLQLWASIAGGLGSIPGERTNTSCAVWHSQKLIIIIILKKTMVMHMSLENKIMGSSNFWWVWDYTREQKEWISRGLSKAVVYVKIHPLFFSV